MRFLRDAVITILLLAMVAATTAVVVVRRGGLSADTEPGRLERSVAARLVRLAIPADADRQQSPLEGQADVWREAREHYLDHCAVCHGRDAKGNTDMGANMHRRCPIRLPPRFSVAATGRCSTSFRMASDGPVCLRGRKSTRPRTRSWSHSSGKRPRSRKRT